jgi:hypothetical protein
MKSSDFDIVRYIEENMPDVNVVRLDFLEGKSDLAPPGPGPQRPRADKPRNPPLF